MIFIFSLEKKSEIHSVLLHLGARSRLPRGFLLTVLATSATTELALINHKNVFIKSLFMMLRMNTQTNIQITSRKIKIEL